MKKLEEKRQQLIGIILLVVMAIFYFKILLFPLFGKFRKTAELSAQYRRDLNITEAGWKQMDQVNQDIERLEALVGKARRHFPSERELPVLLEELSEIAENAEVKILEITPGTGGSPSKGPAIKGLRELPIMITALSGYHQFGTFVNALENSERVYLIRDLSIRSRDENERLHSLRLVLSVFLQEEGLVP